MYTHRSICMKWMDIYGRQHTLTHTQIYFVQYKLWRSFHPLQWYYYWLFQRIILNCYGFSVRLGSHPFSCSPVHCLSACLPYVSYFVFLLSSASLSRLRNFSQEEFVVPFLNEWMRIDFLFSSFGFKQLFLVCPLLPLTLTPNPLSAQFILFRVCVFACVYQNLMVNLGKWPIGCSCHCKRFSKEKWKKGLRLQSFERLLIHIQWIDIFDQNALVMCVTTHYRRYIHFSLWLCCAHGWGFSLE